MIENVIRPLREAKALTQEDVARALGIDRSAIAHFEAGEESALSVETLLKLAPLLDINPDYVLNKAPNPFKPYDPSGIIVLFLKGKAFHANIEPVGVVMEYGAITGTLFLSSSRLSGTRRFKKVIGGRTAIYALALQDVDDNIYLALHRDPDSFIGYLDDLSAAIREKGPDVTANTISPDERLLDSLRQRTVQRDDLAAFFDYKYSIPCPRLKVVLPDGTVRYFPKLPMPTIMRDVERYLQHEPDAEAKKNLLRQIVLFGLKAERKIVSSEESTREYEKRLEKAFKAHGLAYSPEELRPMRLP
ncbi:MAG: helix-turn-helix transcriptional regulator [Syntrophorhabdales bacterium]|jgi:transcriptional regulator with XRE-family HTH domain